MYQTQLFKFMNILYIILFILGIILVFINELIIGNIIIGVVFLAKLLEKILIYKISKIEE